MRRQKYRSFGTAATAVAVTACYRQDNRDVRKIRSRPVFYFGLRIAHHHAVRLYAVPRNIGNYEKSRRDSLVPACRSPLLKVGGQKQKTKAAK